MNTTIELTDIEAKSFIRFQKHRAIIELLESVKAFDVKSGSVTIHFNSFGGIVSITKEEHYTPTKVIASNAHE